MPATDQFKVWVQIERIPGDGSEPEDVTEEECIANFGSEQEARAFVEGFFQPIPGLRLVRHETT